jgi:hypothetical protein
MFRVKKKDFSRHSKEQTWQGPKVRCCAPATVLEAQQGLLALPVNNPSRGFLIATTGGFALLHAGDVFGEVTFQRRARVQLCDCGFELVAFLLRHQQMAGGIATKWF